MSHTTQIKTQTVITAHMNADFDALASMVAASKLYPDCALVFPGSQEKDLRNFYIQSTMYLFNFRNIKEIDIDSVELLVVCDTRQTSRLLHVEPLISKPGIVIHAYDHHPDSDEDVVANRLNYKPWGSTTAIIVDELIKENITLNTEEATMLGLGIYEDTGAFTYNSTTEHDLAAAAWLRGQGMDLGVISDLISRELSAEQISLLGELLDQATTHDIHGVEVVITQISTDYFVSDFAFLVHKLIDMENIRVLFALGRMGDRIHVVARSSSPDVDVGQICASFGGGGHVYAASATVKDKTLIEVNDDLFALLYSHINPQVVVESIMSKPCMSIEDSMTMDEALEFMGRYGFKGMPVVAQGTNRCVGLLDHAVADKSVTHKLGNVPVSEYMAREFHTVPPETDLYQVMEIILGKRQRILPVTSKGDLIGIITNTDLLNLLIEEPARIPESLSPDRRNKERNISSIMKNRLPRPLLNFLKEAGELAKEMGFEVYAVGGFIRDILLGTTNLDLDLVVEGDGILFAKRLAEHYGARIKSHHKFRTAVVIFPDGKRVDVATARLEYYAHPAALPTVELSSIKMDLYRRDFTMNALAVNLTPRSFGILVDFFGAQRDIKDRTIRVLHSLSFVEDPTRVLRAIRFEQRFNFKIGGQTLRLIKNTLQLNLFNRLSGARIFHELQLILNEEHPANCLIRLSEMNILPAIHPLLEINTKRKATLEELEKVHTWYNLLYLESDMSPWRLYFLGLTLNIDRADTQNILRRLSVTAKDEREFLNMRELIGETLGKLMHFKTNASKLSDLYFLMEKLPVEGVLFLMARSRKEDIKRNISQYLARLRFHTLEVDGNDLKRMGITPGPAFSEILREVRAATIDGEVETREEQLELARRYSRKLREQTAD
ncbi:MAG: CBS domain-containing protein [Proteobacteria bacterium]|nr:CBS domain-containing protein [Pseudomonadota bacterium]